MKKRWQIVTIICLILLLGLINVFSVAAEEKTEAATATLLKEQVKCIFVNSESQQKCYTEDGRFGCYGVGTCVADVSGEKGTKLNWKSSCEGDASTVVDQSNEYAEFKCSPSEKEKPNTPTTTTAARITEQVKCIFVNADSEQKCYTEDSVFLCSGVGTCVTDVSGEKGTKLTWKSSCKGYAYTVIDGNNDYAEFKCASTESSASTSTPTAPQKGAAKAKVKCVFIGSDAKQECYSDTGAFRCSGSGNCIVEVSGEKGTKFTWKSSCGGYEYTVLSAAEDSVEFKCVPEELVTEEQIQGKGFRRGYWQCYNGGEQQGDLDSCTSSKSWQKRAQDFCAGKCYADGSKCGVNAYSVSDECYLDGGSEDAVFLPSIAEEGKKRETKAEEKKEEILICKDSCPLEGKCYPFGYRKSSAVCSDSGSFIKQLPADAVCENNFECQSNVCIDGSCVRSGLIQKILAWFTELFE